MRFKFKLKTKMDKFLSTILMLATFVLCLSTTEATISGWTDENSNNGPTFTVTSAENIADTVNVITLTATTGDTVSEYTIASQNNTDQFEVVKTSETGVVSLKTGKSLDREAGTPVVVIVKAVDADGSSSATVSITVTDINDNIPAFTAPASATHSVEVKDKSTASTVVYTVVAADDDATDNTITYAIESGDTNTDFEIGDSNGAITVAKTLDKARASTYALIVTATDAGTSAKKTGTVTINVTVCDPCSSDNGVGTVSVSIITLLTALMMSLYNVM